jgi:integrase
MADELSEKGLQTCITWSRAGGDGADTPKVVADLLGHSTTRLTLDTYTHVLPELTRQAADHLDAILTSEQIE